MTNWNALRIAEETARENGNTNLADEIYALGCFLGSSAQLEERPALEDAPAVTRTVEDIYEELSGKFESRYVLGFGMVAGTAFLKLHGLSDAERLAEIDRIVEALDRLDRERLAITFEK